MSHNILSTPNNFNYALDYEEAYKRFNIWREVDPFPDIPPALLNSADVADYVFTVGMIWPFYCDDLKSAAYEMRLGNEFLCWDENDKEINAEILDDDTFLIKRNSITYVTLKQKFLLPDYIAVRFNLTINHVHRGLLLGTGPLVNPAFQGKLMIPLHNLTPNDYLVRPGDKLINVEFTKLSPIKEWGRAVVSPRAKGVYVRKEKIGNDTLLDCLKRSLPSGIEKVQSSLSEALEKTKNELNSLSEFSKQETKKISDDARNEIKNAARSRLIVTFSTVAGILALAIMTWQIFQSYQSRNSDKRFEFYNSIASQKNSIENIDYEIRKLRFLILSNQKNINKNELIDRINKLQEESNQTKVSIKNLENSFFYKE